MKHCVEGERGVHSRSEFDQRAGARRRDRRDWLAKDADGKRLIDNPDDWVRREIAEALQRDIPVIPVLVGDIPPTFNLSDLPPDIAPIAYRQAIRIRHRNDEQDLEILASAIAWMKPGVDLTVASDVADEASAATSDEVAIHIQQ